MEFSASFLLHIAGKSRKAMRHWREPEEAAKNIVRSAYKRPEAELLLSLSRVQLFNLMKNGISSSCKSSLVTIFPSLTVDFAFSLKAQDGKEYQTRIVLLQAALSFFCVVFMIEQEGMNQPVFRGRLHIFGCTMSDGILPVIHNLILGSSGTQGKLSIEKLCLVSWQSLPHTEKHITSAMELIFFGSSCPMIIPRHKDNSKSWVDFYPSSTAQLALGNRIKFTDLGFKPRFCRWETRQVAAVLLFVVAHGSSRFKSLPHFERFVNSLVRSLCGPNCPLIWAVAAWASYR